MSAAARTMRTVLLNGKLAPLRGMNHGIQSRQPAHGGPQHECMLRPSAAASRPRRVAL